jgi:hypothetical protein
MDHLTDAPVANILILAGIIFLAVGLFGRIGGFIGSIFGNIEAGKNSRVLAGVLGALLIVGGAWLHEGGHKPAVSTPSSTTPAQVASPAASTPPAGTATPSATTSAAPEVPHEAPGTKARATTPVKTIKPATPEVSTASAAHDRSPASVPPASVEDSLVGTSLVGTWTNPILAANSISRIEVKRDEIGLHAHIWDTCTAGECDMGTHRLRPSGTTATYGYTVGPRRRMGSLNPYATGVTLLSVDILEPATERRWHYNFVLLKSTAPDNVRAAFSKYLKSRSQKAFAMAPGGAWGDRFGSASADDARQTALQNCVERGKPGCRIILVNNDATE